MTKSIQSKVEHQIKSILSTLTERNEEFKEVCFPIQFFYLTFVLPAMLPQCADTSADPLHHPLLLGHHIPDQARTMLPFTKRDHSQHQGVQEEGQDDKP